MDSWSLCQKLILKIPPLNYALVGRWILWLPQGKFRHHTILSASQIRGENLTGWVFHYLTGILFAVIPLLLNGRGWLHEPSLFTGVLTGLLTMIAPFLILQPALGFGIAASRTPHPWLARLLSLITHLYTPLPLLWHHHHSDIEQVKCQSTHCHCLALILSLS